uniref:Formylglycine-generating enzyme, required for sulfatase activity, contains SUMF1/FGE domain n=1 Tax=Candidatus Kentrum sp. MB TaxID=2138164 RepID=A0A450XKU9_9GAMM|nr:MAG: Formylglycine-generating enzyme, required for sulfatase activity, contains SUMF1/FGE domain [Candidatus Kentron sp. MB]
MTLSNQPQSLDQLLKKTKPASEESAKPATNGRAEPAPDSIASSVTSPVTDGAMDRPLGQSLDQARKKTRRYYLLGLATIVCVLLVVFGIFTISNGTRIQVLPEEAAHVATMEVAGGVAFSVGDTVYSLAKAPMIAVSADGFKTRTERIPAGNLGGVFPIELFPLPGYLTIETSPPGEKTAWLINSRHVATVTRLEQELEPGAYEITIDDPYSLKKELQIDIEREERKHLKVTLEPISGALEIASQPGATVEIDGDHAGSTPLRVTKKGGRYAVRLSAPNYEDILDHVEIERRTPVAHRDYRLESKKGRIVVELEPAGGSLLVNGVKADLSQPLRVDALRDHRLIYTKPGYLSQTQTIRLSHDEERRLSFRLKPNIGLVKITSSPAAEVQINGKKRGVTPMRIRLPAVSHRITLVKPGYQSVTRTVRPQAGATQKVSVTLLSLRALRLRNAPREYTNPFGIRLKLFRPGNDKLTMGAARHEKGQRANEFLRTVRLKRPFYAGLYEITNAQFRKSPGANPPSSSGGANQPVTSLSWNQAAAFCNRLSQAEKLSPFYRTRDGKIIGFDPEANGYRLLTEAEWEWLARKAGRHQQTIFSWGNRMIIPPRAANVADESAKGKVTFYVPNYTDGYPGIAPVGSFRREKSGLYDLAGNVSEWVHDFYLVTPPDSGSIEIDPLGPRRGQGHLLKGANWRSGAITELRPAFRQGLLAGRDDLGFRIGRYL